ncbi:hypothetical protein CO665_34595 [Rhizobium anhuiense]|nr:hypothetical protein CO665_34595 [Rhizobium anhuiense]
MMKENLTISFRRIVRQSNHLLPIGSDWVPDTLDQERHCIGQKGLHPWLVVSTHPHFDKGTSRCVGIARYPHSKSPVSMIGSIHIFRPDASVAFEPVPINDQIMHEVERVEVHHLHLNIAAIMIPTKCGATMQMSEKLIPASMSNRSL